MFREGGGVKTDKQESVKCFKKAADVRLKEVTKREDDQLKEETKREDDQLKEVIKRELSQAKDEFDSAKKENKPLTQSIIVGGFDEENQIGENKNNYGQNDDSIISPPLNLFIDPSSILSFSVYSKHSVLVTNDGKLKGTGDNSFNRISHRIKQL